MKTSDPESIMKIIKEEALYLQSQFGIEQIALFGSFARSDAGEDSDIDLVVSLSKPSGLAFIQLADYLVEKLGKKLI